MYNIVIDVEMQDVTLEGRIGIRGGTDEEEVLKCKDQHTPILTSMEWKRQAETSTPSEQGRRQQRFRFSRHISS